MGHKINIKINPAGNTTVMPDKSRCKNPLERYFQNPQKKTVAAKDKVTNKKI